VEKTMTGTILDPYSWQAERVVAESGADVESGLSRDAASERLARLGPNTLPAAVSKGPLIRFLLQFNSPLIYVLLACMAVSAIIGERVDAGVILAVVLVNAVVGFAQETRAEHALETLAAMTRTFAIVIRGGARLRVPSAEVVPGDLVVLAAGDKVPGDLRLVQAAELTVDESALTGESVPVLKDPAELPPETSLADRRNMVYSATLVTYGSGLGIVVATGARTELGAIHRLISTAEGIQTPLTRKLTRFSTNVTVSILALAAVTFGIGLLRGQPVTEMLTAAVALAVGAIPEGLPAVVTVTLAFGTARMVGRHAIVRKLPAVETLGSTTVICTDKTGTLTENQMTVTVIAAAGQAYEVTGTGYSPDDSQLLGHRCDGGPLGLVLGADLTDHANRTPAQLRGVGELT
jgi:cation-transporting ATPase F